MSLTQWLTIRVHVVPAPGIWACRISLEQLGLCMLLITSFHILDSSDPNLHNHLNTIALFLSLKDPTLRPLTLFRRVTVAQLTLHTFLLFSFPDHIKNLNFFSIVVATVAGMGNRICLSTMPTCSCYCEQ